MSTRMAPAAQRTAPESTTRSSWIPTAVVVLALIIAVPAVLVTQTAVSQLFVMQASTLTTGVGASVLLFTLSPSA